MINTPTPPLSRTFLWSYSDHTLPVIKYLMNPKNLREEAERIIRNLKDNRNKTNNNIVDKDKHNLQVYQIELELQNDELRRSSDELTKSHKRFTDLFEHAPVGYFLLNEDFVILNVNLSATQMLNSDKTGILDKPFPKFIHPNWQDKFYFLMQKVLESDTLLSEEINLVAEDKKALYAQLQSIRDFDVLTGAKRIRLVIIDISERKSIERKLNRFRAALDSTADNIFLIDFESAYFIDVNDSASQNLGYTREEFLQMKPVDINPEYHEDVILQLRQEKLFDVNSSVTLETQYHRKNGEIFDVEVFVKTVFIDQEKVIVAVARDITERKKSQLKLATYAAELEELNTAKDRFLSIISHDLRGPFLSLKGYTQMLMEEYDLLPKEEIMEYLGIVNESSKDLYQLVDNLLKWSRLELGKIPYEPLSFNLYVEIESVIKLLSGIAQKKDITLINHIKKDHYPIADRLMLISIMQNLVGNAIKFTRKNGYVKISSAQEKDKIRITVEDNGVGIPPEIMEKLFTLDKGHTSKGTAGEKGTGFGLIITKEMLKKMGGDIEVHSEVDKGSIFSFRLSQSDHKPNNQ